ncbi:LOV domain-containing protein [Canna indica]|uniref:LOV domain-containing protein n=1 Tax=Canna indica TaxID=4628 RepID=A0AAQ3QIN0_9LILI|nr:LOV domain-containing protein [Canna indica]
MAAAISDVAQTRSVLRALGEHPDQETIDAARARIAEVDEDLCRQLEEIALAPHFLQGLETDQMEIEKIRDAVKNRKTYCGRLLNYKKDGTKFWNLLTITPIRNENGSVIKFIGMQVEVSKYTEGLSDKTMRPNALPMSLIRYDDRDFVMKLDENEKIHIDSPLQVSLEDKNFKSQAGRMDSPLNAKIDSPRMGGRKSGRSSLMGNMLCYTKSIPVIYRLKAYAIIASGIVIVDSIYYRWWKQIVLSRRQTMAVIYGYYSSFQLSEKSDVYSFGMVILELITGRPSIFMTSKQSASLVVWVRQRLANGYIEDIVDARLQRQHDVNSIWKAADVALRCTELAAHKRPAMADVVLELKESLALEIGYRKSEIPSASNNSTYARGAADKSVDTNAHDERDDANPTLHVSSVENKETTKSSSP